MLYSVDFENACYLYHDNKDFISLINQTGQKRYEFLIDEKYAVSFPDEDAEYLILFVDGTGLPVAIIGTLKTVYKFFEVEYIDQIFRLSDILTKSVIMEVECEQEEAEKES